MELEVHLEEKLASINRGDVGPNLALPRWPVSKPRASQVAREGPKVDDGNGRLETQGKRSKAIIDRRSFSRGLSGSKGRRRERSLSIVLAFHPRCWPPRE